MRKMFFTHTLQFGDGTAYLVSEPRGVFLVSKNGRKTPWINRKGNQIIGVKACMDHVRSGHWRQITEKQAKSLLHHPLSSLCLPAY